MDSLLDCFYFHFSKILSIVYLNFCYGSDNFCCRLFCSETFLLLSKVSVAFCPREPKNVSRRLRKGRFKTSCCMFCLFSHVQLFLTIWTVAHQAALSMGFSKQEYYSELPFPSLGIFPIQGSYQHFLYLLHYSHIL